MRKDGRITGWTLGHPDRDDDTILTVTPAHRINKSHLVDGYILEGGDGKVYRLQEKSPDWAYNLVQWCAAMEKFEFPRTPQGSKVTLTTSPEKSLKSAGSSQRSTKSCKSTGPPESVTVSRPLP